MKITSLPHYPGIRFDAAQPTPVIARFKSRRGERVTLFVGDDNSAVWLELRRGRHSDTVKLSQQLVKGIQEETRRRYPVGLQQPHFGRVALEWIHQRKINLEALGASSTDSAVSA